MAVRGAVVAEGRTGDDRSAGGDAGESLSWVELQKLEQKVGHQWPESLATGVQPCSTSEAPLSGWRPADYWCWGSLTTLSPPVAHPQNIGVFFITITYPFFLS